MPGHAPGGLLRLYRQIIPAIERNMRDAGCDAVSVERYQSACRELETLIEATGTDDRHDFVVVIPVADRPRHLEACLDSLLELCRTFGYGGMTDGRYRKVSVVIADDSKEPAPIARHRELAAQFTARGLATRYLGLAEQVGLLDRLPAQVRQGLANIVGTADVAAFHHKGPSIMRNIAYLALNGLRVTKTLFWFVDSDQEFRIRLHTAGADRDVYALNYFHHLDAHFGRGAIHALTGKVVGDPPVSPAVMAGTFLDDVLGFLRQIAACAPDAACAFHDTQRRVDTGAAYHDMAGLFGFETGQVPFAYRCALEGAHDHTRCLADFAAGLPRFFDGEHATRQTYFDVTEDASRASPARTVYTGNYVLRADALRYFVPFATLRLRMAGPVLGRILRAELGEGFVSANLPMLHKRTVAETGQAEFRPGIEKTEQAVDLSGEFERQFFGDVMLFTMEKLTALGYPQTAVPEAEVARLLAGTEAGITQRYRDKQAEIQQKLAALRALLHGDPWWHAHPQTQEARTHLAAFLENMERNFGAQARGYQAIASADNRALRQRQMLGAILQYPADCVAWDAALGTVVRA